MQIALLKKVLTFTAPVALPPQHHPLANQGAAAAGEEAAQVVQGSAAQGGLPRALNKAGLELEG